MWLRISIIMFLFTIVSCSEPSKPDAPRYQKIPENPPLQEEKTLIFALVAPDAYADPILFNHWNTLKKTKGNVHVFAHDPDQLTDFSGRKRMLSYDPDDMADFSGIKHQANQTNISEKMAEVLAQSTATRLIIFIATHGARTGNWCYQNKYVCDLTEASLIETLKKQADLSNQSLKHVLVVPSSCFSKPIMDKFGAQIKERSWPFEISYLSQSVYQQNSTGNAALGLFNNLMIPQMNVSDSHLEQFFSMTTLNEFVALNNSLISPLLPAVRMDLCSSSAIKLEDFGFDIGFLLRIGIKGPRPKVPFKSSVEDVIKHLPVAKKFYPFIKEIRFGLQDFKYEAYRFTVDGNIKKKLVDPKYENIEYVGFNIIFRNNS